MTSRTLSTHEKELVRAWRIVGRVVFDQKTENAVAFKHQLFYKVGERFWQTSYKNLDFYDEAACFNAKLAIVDIIIALRQQIESMYAELAEPCEVLTKPDDLKVGVSNALSAMNVMKKIVGAFYSFGKNADTTMTKSTGKVIAFFSINEYATAITDQNDEVRAAEHIIANIGIYVVGVMLKEYDELVKRCSTPKRVADELWAQPELVSRRLLVKEETEEESKEPRANSKKRKNK